MARTVLVVAAAFLMASMTADNVWAQAGGGGAGGGSAFGGGTTGGGGFGQSAGFGQTGAFGQGGGLAAGYGGFANQGNQQLQNQTRNLQQTLQQNRQQIQPQQNVTNLQNLVPTRLQYPTVSVRPATIAAAAPVQAKLARVMATRGSAAIAMWEGDVLVLSGNVANEAVRRQIEGIALLEPGVRSVRNETVVGPVAAPVVQ
jgi:hypothetical protein